MDNEQNSDEQETPSKAIVKKAPLEVGEKGYIAPKNVEDAARMATAVIMGGFAPDSYKIKGSETFDNNKVLLGIMSALEAGLPPLYGLRQIAIINGRPTIWGDAAMALVQSKNLIAGYKEEQIGTKPTDKDLNKWPDDYGWRVTIERRGQTGSYVGEFTVGMAKRARLWMNAKKVPWLEHPDRMLKIRARAFPLRDGFADALAGLAIREEIEDMHEIESKAPEIMLASEGEVDAPPMGPMEELHVNLKTPEGYTLEPDTTGELDGEDDEPAAPEPEKELDV